MATLSKEVVIERGALEEVGGARLAEAEALREAGLYAGSIYLAGYAVECWLKVAICVTLGWHGLCGTFKTHDLEALMLYSGFDGRLRESPLVVQSFAQVVEMWVVEGNRSLRYQRPSSFDEPSAALFLECVKDPDAGVVPWLQRMIS